MESHHTGLLVLLSLAALAPIAKVARDVLIVIVALWRTRPEDREAILRSVAGLWLARRPHCPCSRGRNRGRRASRSRPPTIDS
jgi:hypothetical protein